MSTMTLIFHLPPLWLPESKVLALELSANGEQVVCLIPREELHRRYKTKPDLNLTEALTVFDTFREEIEGDVRSLLERHGLPAEGVPRPLVFNLAAPAGPWCLPSRARQTAVAD